MVFNVGKGGKVQSSSWMIGDASRAVARSVRPWGAFYGWDKGAEWNLKTIYIAPGKRLSLQYHHHRREHWMLVEGDAIATLRDTNDNDVKQSMKIGETVYVGTKTVHRLESKKGGIVVEIALGTFDENDIVRIEDDHGRVE
jgi:mannose-6-phosphate isomerase